MKRKNILLSFGLAALIFGAGAGIALKTVNKGAVETRATGEENMSTIYLDVSNTNWESKGQTIYVHYWGGAAESTWPGISMMKDSFGLYTAKVRSDSNGVKFHVSENWGGDCETGNLTFNSSKMLWSITSQGTPCQASSSTCVENTVYVLDLENKLLGTKHQAHIWGGSSYGTSWPGATMSNVSGRIYTVNYPSIHNKIIFNNSGVKDSGQTADLAIEAGKCSVLKRDWDGTKWVSLAAAQFIDGYMHFNDVSTETGGHTVNCDTYYSAAKIAYNALSESVQKEVLSVSEVSARLANWAEAHGDILNPEGGDLAKVSLGGLTTDSSNLVVAITAISVLSLASVIGFAFIKRRKVNR